MFHVLRVWHIVYRITYDRILSVWRLNCCVVILILSTNVVKTIFLQTRYLGYSLLKWGTVILLGHFYNFVKLLYTVENVGTIKLYWVYIKVFVLLLLSLVKLLNLFEFKQIWKLCWQKFVSHTDFFSNLLYL